MIMTDNIERIIKLIEPIVTEESCELIDVDLTSDFGQRVLRVYIDKDGGVELGDCTRVSHAIEDLLEVEDAITGAYNLEVSSPGLNRPLRLLSHFQKAVGKIVNVVAKEKLNGRKNYKGILKGVDDGDLVITIDNADFSVPLDQVAKARLVYKF